MALKLDRLSRSTRDILDLAEDAQKRDWRLVSVSESLDTATATGRFTLTERRSGVSLSNRTQRWDQGLGSGPINF